MTDYPLDERGRFALRLYGYLISDGHLRWLLRGLDERGLTPEDVHDAYRGFSVAEACELLDLTMFELYALLVYFRFHVPSYQREYASRRRGSYHIRRFTDDGQLKEEE